eukprot:CAMPEP_0184868818 /NCGR_PEP_ID=MMETSP0580-20130426/31849_1 /TAXON_ID=1118495 /ORGANISM="Dactyliosolen fragilissimus" /LENGTH=1240 /DNA_ID=CAMNT_0027369937 /DNA_START=98 /DNA_END=3820 /DNA_ORIENTATION=-
MVKKKKKNVNLSTFSNTNDNNNSRRSIGNGGGKTIFMHPSNNAIAHQSSLLVSVKPLSAENKLPKTSKNNDISRTNTSVKNGTGITVAGDCKDHILFLREEDARVMNVENGDPLLVLHVKEYKLREKNFENVETTSSEIVWDHIGEKIGQNKKFGCSLDSDSGNVCNLGADEGYYRPRFIAFCRAKIYDPSAGGTEHKKINSTNSSPSMKKRIASVSICKGECKIGPFHLSERLFTPLTNITVTDSIATPLALTPIITSSEDFTNTHLQHVNHDDLNAMIVTTSINTKVNTMSINQLNSPITSPPIIKAKTTTKSNSKNISTRFLSSPSSFSPSKTSFSFARRSDGDDSGLTNSSSSPRVLLTPNSLSQKISVDHDSHYKGCDETPTPTMPNSYSFKRQLILLPLHSNREIARVVLGKATHLHLKWIPRASDLNSRTNYFPANDSTIQTYLRQLKRSTRILTHMIHATTSRGYFGVGDILPISFQGRKLNFLVHNLRGKNNGDYNPDYEMKLSQSIQKLHLDHNDKVLTKNENAIKICSESDYHGPRDTSIEESRKYVSNSTSILDQLKARANSRWPLLVKICSDTSITFQFEADRRPKDPDLKVNTTDNKNKVAGLDSTIHEIYSILVHPLFFPQKFPTSGLIRPPRGVLLHGASGTGKTLLASQIASQLKSQSFKKKTLSIVDIDTVWINCADIQSSTSFVGKAEKKLAQIFDRAEDRAINDCVSTLVVLDDIHFICPRRGKSDIGGGVTDRVASTLLALLDGIGKISSEKSSIPDTSTTTANVAVLATTNNPSLLDPALRRAGRLDNEVEIPVPDDRKRCDILRLLLDQLSLENIEVPTLDDEQYMSISRKAKGCNGADVALGIKDAVRNAILRSKYFDKSHMNSNNRKSEQQGENLSPSAVQITTQDLVMSLDKIKPSSIKSISIEVPHIPWSSIGGMDLVKQQLREAIELPLTHSHLFSALCIQPPRGVLLYGPPGCSKTLMARALATEGKMNFLAVKGPELLSKWLGESERALAFLFRRARMASPCVIFFDEIDAIASKRGGGENSSGGERMLSQLLTELDGISTSSNNQISKGSNYMSESDKNNDDKNITNDNFESYAPRVVVVGATNRPDLLDDALTRPGRIDKMIYVGLPDKASRKEILKLGLIGKSCHDVIDFDDLASDKLTGGFSGAELISICREAAFFAIEEYDNTDKIALPIITSKHLIQSIKGIKRQITPQMLDFYSSYSSSKNRF